MLVCRNLFLGTDTFILGDVYCIFYLSVVKLPTILPFIFFTQLFHWRRCIFLAYLLLFFHLLCNKLPVLYLVRIITQLSFIVNFSLIVFIHTKFSIKVLVLEVFSFVFYITFQIDSAHFMGGIDGGGEKFLESVLFLTLRILCLNTLSL